MSAAPILLMRRAVVAHLRADAVVTSLLPSGRIYGERPESNAVRPFMRYGMSDSVPGYDVTAPLHIFSGSDFTDEIARIIEEIQASLDGAVLTLESGEKIYMRVTSTRIIPDAAEQNAWHGVVTVKGHIPRDCTAP